MGALKFEQTSAGRLLLEHFVQWGEFNAHTTGDKTRAWDLQCQYTRNYSVSDVRRVGALANQKLRYALFNSTDNPNDR